MEESNFIEFKEKYLSYKDYYHVNNIKELEELLLTFNPRECNFVGYLWHEYGFIQSLLNYTFKEFFDNNKDNGKIIGTCLPGMEILYRGKVDILIVLDNFINTKNAIENGKYTEKWKNVTRSVSSDSGVAFWHAIKNFNEEEFNRMIEKINFKNTIWPHYYGNGSKNNFYKNKFGMTNLGHKFTYATGEKELCAPENGEKQRGLLEMSKTFSFNLNNNYPVLFDTPYAAFFIRNNHKNYTGISQTDQQIKDIFNWSIANKIHLILFQDFFEIEIPDSDYLHSIKMENYLDIDKLVYYTYNCSYYFATPGSTTELVSHNTFKSDIILTKNVHELWIKSIKCFQNKKNKKLLLISNFL